MILPQSFYNQNTLKVAQDLLGCFLVRELPFGFPLLTKERVRVRYKIVETEAYDGPFDLASHASRGLTLRNKIMFGASGQIYVYLTYGLHHMLNIVTGPENYPAAVLIRAVEPILSCHSCEGRNPEKKFSTNGPAKLTKALQINKYFNDLPIYTKKYGLWIEGRKEIIKPSQIIKTTRIGIDYAGKYKKNGVFI
ncbi:MAG: hypothetical protein UT48_C0014G0002 [Parcubacteria group bacterium GW2011_GWE2_39_37]|uniref:Putative 3-methyladenine DNA glycosylase n=1 Tax=Candidatus Falkowbacteria bacterium GW2011_GWF2_39_8 TaxID=1618642 RepID=A0A0G0SAI9_9BACT|nr:MAG: hypothetical protein UT48_C0014G0002 [Parcubacteria group bacterium GW2011_GWE2_39_37]KKR31775.1 MAG: hypothetical protein UT64_C0051G0006 [Candidatus Falkowbacteria bacterium GW2011_GWF2_39_8]